MFRIARDVKISFENAKIHDYKMLVNDGSRIVGDIAYKTGKIDLIDKGVYSPCNSKINIKNFLCPIWQVEGEKIMPTHFYNAKQASEYIKRVLEVREKIIVRIHHYRIGKALHMNLIQELSDGKTRTHHVKFSKRHYESSTSDSDY